MANFVIPYTTPGNYTYDSEKVEVTGGLARLKDISSWDRLVAYWRMNETTWVGTQPLVLDTSDSNYHGTRYSPADTVAGGKLGRCGNFTNDSGRVEVPHADCPNLEFTTGDFAMAGWFKKDASLASQGRLWGKKKDSLEGYRLTQFGTNGVVRFDIYEVGGTFYQVDSVDNIDDTNWHFVVVHRDNTNNKIEMWIDNVWQASTVTTSISTANDRAFCIGTNSGGSDTRYIGLIDEVMVFNNLLSSVERDFLWNEGNGQVLNSSAYVTDKPTIYKTAGDTDAQLIDFTTFVETLGGGNEGSVTYQLADDGATWKYWSGSAWVVAGASDYNAASVVNTNIPTFPSALDTIYVKAFLISDGAQKVELDQDQVGYTVPNTPPNIYAGTNKTCKRGATIAPFSDCTFSDPDGTVTNAYYRVVDYTDTWTEIPQGGYGTLLLAVQAFTYQFDGFGPVTVWLRVKDNEAATSDDSLIVTVAASDWVKPLKIETSALGTETDLYPTEVNPIEDGVYTNSIAFADTSTVITKDESNNLALLDANAGRKTLNSIATKNDARKLAIIFS